MITDMKPKVIAVVGPTATGKSDLAVRLAKEFGGEVISCDSMQVYRGMDIGTAKVTEAEMQGVPHHMIDIADPCENYSCARYADEARAVLADVLARGVLPVFCGGTGQYLDSVLTGNVFSGAGIDEDLRARLAARDEDSLWQELAQVDPEAAAATHKNNKKRVIRALETYILTGITKTEWDARSRLTPSPYNTLKIGLFASEREQLCRRIEARVDAMMDAGLVEEVRALCLREDSTAYDAIGYRQVCEYLRGECTLPECVERIKRDSRRYAKRQMTWFKADGGVHWIDTVDADKEKTAAVAIKTVNDFLRENNG